MAASEVQAEVVAVVATALKDVEGGGTGGGVGHGHIGAAHLRWARRHGVDVFLYPWLAARGEVLATWRQRFLTALVQDAQLEQQLKELLSALNAVGVRVVPLKGVWLRGRVYHDSSLRTMSDIDILVPPTQQQKADMMMARIGYRTAAQQMGNSYTHARQYRHAAWRLVVEVHHSVASALDVPQLRVAMAAVWQQVLTGTCCGVAVYELPPVEVLAHLTHHALHHYLAVPLRSWLDIALLLRRYGGEFSEDQLRAAAQRWRVERALPFVVRFVGELFGLELSPAVASYAADLSKEQLAQMRQILYTLPTTDERTAEGTVIEFSRLTLGGRVALGLRRIFMPREFLARDYPQARHFWGLPVAWCCRAYDLWRTHGARVRRVVRREAAAERQLTAAMVRRDLVGSLLDE